MSQTLGFVPSRPDSIALPPLQFPLLLTLCTVKTQALESEIEETYKMKECMWVCVYSHILCY